MTDKHTRLTTKSKIDCLDFFLIAGEYNDSEVAPELQKKLTKHLEDCQACGIFDAEYKLTMQAIAALREREYQQTAADRARLRAALQERLAL